MAVIKKKRKKAVPAVSTASLPDIIFTLLFFFMVSAKVKDSALKVSHTMPQAINAKKLTKKEKIATIHLGVPTPAYREIYGTEPVIQLDNKLVGFDEVSKVREFIPLAIQKIPYDKRSDFLLTIKADKDAKTGLVKQVLSEAQKANPSKDYALRVNLESGSKTY